MDFSKINNINIAKKKLESKKPQQFDAHEFLNKADKLTHQIDSYFMGEPNELLVAMDKFDLSNDFAIFEMEICPAEIMRKHL
jgi:hypothetical protein